MADRSWWRPRTRARAASTAQAIARSRRELVKAAARTRHAHYGGEDLDEWDREYVAWRNNGRPVHEVTKA